MTRCQNCGHRDHEIEFVPSDGDPSPFVCPKCGSTQVFSENGSTGKPSAIVFVEVQRIVKRTGLYRMKAVVGVESSDEADAVKRVAAMIENGSLDDGSAVGVVSWPVFDDVELIEVTEEHDTDKPEIGVVAYKWEGSNT